MRLMLAVATAAVLVLPAAAGTAGFAFLQVPAGARAVALGGAFTAVPGDPMGLYWNPATLCALGGQEFTSTYTGYLMDMQAGFVGWAKPSGDHAVGASVNYFYGGTFQRTTMTEPTGTGEEFSTNGIAAGGSYARRLSPDLAVGATGRFVYSSIDTYNGNGFLVDAGVLYTPSALSLGLAVRNAGLQTKPFYEENDPMPTEVAAGASMPLLDGRLLVAADLTYPFQGDFNAAVGIEYSPVDMLTLRAGGNLRDKEASDQAGGSLLDALAFGAGTGWSMISLDYAFKPFADLGTIHRISLGIGL